MLKAGQHEAERLIFATGEHAGTLVGRVSQFCRDLVDALKRFGAHLLRMVEGVRYSAQRDTRLVGDVVDGDGGMASHGASKSALPNAVMRKTYPLYRFKTLIREQALI